MYARVSTFRINTEKFDEYQAQVEKFKPEIMALPGIKYWFSAANEDGSCASIAVYENEEAAAASSIGAGAIFGQFAEFMESEPQPQGYQLILHGVNP